MNITIVIQADMAAPPLPCKEMLSLRGLPVIDWIIYRASKSKLAGDIIVTAPPSKINDALCHHLENQGIAVHENHPGDIQGLLSIAKNENIDALVLVDSSQPFAWGGELDSLIRFHAENDEPTITYAYNNIPANSAWPAGLGGEFLPLPVLKALAAEAERQIENARGNNGKESWKTIFSLAKSTKGIKTSTFDPADKRLHHPAVDLRLNTPDDYRKLALMLVHPDMHPAEIVQRYPRSAS